MQGPSSYNIVSQLILISNAPSSGLFQYNNANTLITWITPPGTTTDPFGTPIPVSGGVVVGPAPGVLQLLNNQINFGTDNQLTPGFIAFALNSLALNSPVTNNGALSTAEIDLISNLSPEVDVHGDLFLIARGSSLGTLKPAGGVQISANNVPVGFPVHFIIQQTFASVNYLLVAASIGGSAQWYTDPNGVILANHPGTSNTPETWQTPSTPGFTGNGTNQPFKFRLTPENILEMEGELSPTGAYVAGTTIFTLPAAYRPPANTNRPITIAVAGGVNASFIAIPSSGAVNIGTAMAAGNVAIIDCRVRLVA